MTTLNKYTVYWIDYSEGKDKGRMGEGSCYSSRLLSDDEAFELALQNRFGRVVESIRFFACDREKTNIVCYEDN